MHDLDGGLILNKSKQVFKQWLEFASNSDVEYLNPMKGRGTIYTVIICSCDRLSPVPSQYPH